MESRQMTGSIAAEFDRPPGGETGGARKSQHAPSNRQPNPHKYLWVSVLVSVLQTEDAGSTYYNGRDYRWVATNAGVDPEALQARIARGELPAIRERIRWARSTPMDRPQRSLLSKEVAQSSASAQASA